VYHWCITAIAGAGEYCESCSYCWRWSWREKSKQLDKKLQKAKKSAENIDFRLTKTTRITPYSPHPRGVKSQKNNVGF